MDVLHHHMPNRVSVMMLPLFAIPAIMDVRLVSTFALPMHWVLFIPVFIIPKVHCVEFLLGKLFRIIKAYPFVLLVAIAAQFNRLLHTLTHPPIAVVDFEDAECCGGVHGAGT